LPLKFGVPIPFNGVLTRSYSSSDNIFYVPIYISDSTYTSSNQYSSQFTPNALYYLIDENSGLKSDNLTDWTIKTEDKSSIVNLSEPILLINGSTPPMPPVTLPLLQNNPNTITFLTWSENLYDYYIECSQNFSVNYTTGTFSAIAATQETIVVHKLLVNGIIYTDSIKVTVP